MAGVDPSGNFVASTFRAQIRATMTMGLPQDVALRPTFHFASDDTYTAVSRSGQPWDWKATPVANNPDKAPIQVPCVLQAANGTVVEFGALGEFDPQNAQIGLCDVDYALVKGFTEVVIAGSTYRYSKLHNVQGLFDFTIFYVDVIAKDVT